MGKQKKLRSIRDIKGLRGKRVLLRLDLNVPLDRGRIIDDTRIEKALPTLKFLKKAGARTIVIAHLGADGAASLRDVARRLGKHLPVGFMPEITGQAVEQAVRSMHNGGILVLENIRRDSGEMEKGTFLAMSLSRLANFYVNDAFSASHRPHASIVLLPKFLPGYVGLQFETELAELTKTFTPKRPFLFILGGAKFTTKVPLIKKFLKIADRVYVGGALMNSFFKAMGHETGRSLTDSAGEDIASLLKSHKLVLPTDVMVNDGEVRRIDEVKRRDTIRDIGPDSLKELISLIGQSKEILFNGPLGYYEMGFDRTTKETIKAMIKAKAHTVVGGGDTLAIVEKLKAEPKLSFVSTAGGAMIEFLSEGTLPGIEALRKSK